MIYGLSIRSQISQKAGWNLADAKSIVCENFALGIDVDDLLRTIREEIRDIDHTVFSIVEPQRGKVIPAGAVFSREFIEPIGADQFASATFYISRNKVGAVTVVFWLKNLHVVAINIDDGRQIL